MADVISRQFAGVGCIIFGLLSLSSLAFAQADHARSKWRV